MAIKLPLVRELVQATRRGALSVVVTYDLLLLTLGPFCSLCNFTILFLK